MKDLSSEVTVTYTNLIKVLVFRFDLFLYFKSILKK